MFNVPIYQCTQVGEVNAHRSEVIPNQAINLREIIQRSARGQFLAEVQANALQYGEDENEDSHDLFEIDDTRQEVHDKLGYYEARVLEMKKAQEAANEAKLAENGKETKPSEGDEPKPAENA